MSLKTLLPCAFLASLALFGQGKTDRFSQLPAMSEEQDRAVDAGALEAKYPGQDAVFLNHVTDYENVVTTSSSGYEWNLLHIEYQKLVIFNPEDTTFSTLSIWVPKEHSLDRVSMSICTPDKKYRQFGLSDLKESRNSDGSATFKFAYPEVVKGSVITQAYVIRNLYGLRNAPLYYEIPLQFRIPCEDISFRIAYPSDWEMGIKKLGDNRVLPMTKTKSQKGDQAIISGRMQGVPALHFEPFSPFYKEVATYAELQIQKLYMQATGWQPVRYKAPKDWSDLCEEFNSDFMDKDPVFSGRVKNKTRELTVNCGSPLEKLDAIISWLQSNMRVVSYAENRASGLNRANFAANLEKQQGTVTQITGLALSMLHEAEIDSKYLLIHSAEEGYFDPTFYSHSQLDAPAVLARIQDKTYVVFPYREHMPVDHVPEEFQGQPALAIDRKGKSAFITLPLGSQSVNETVESYNLTLLEDGKIKVEEERVLQGSTAYSTREALAGLSTRQKENKLKRMLTFSDGKIVLKNHSIDDQFEYKKPLKIKLEYEVENLLTLTPEEVVFNTGGLFAPISRIKAKDSAQDRQSPVRIYFDETSRKTVTIHYPATWQPFTKLEDFKLENPFGSLEGTYLAGQGQLTARLALVLKKTAAPKESYAELQALVGKKTKGGTQAIVFKVKP